VVCVWGGGGEIEFIRSYSITWGRGGAERESARALFFVFFLLRKFLKELSCNAAGEFLVRVTRDQQYVSK
jgi:hypothetical protein